MAKKARMRAVEVRKANGPPGLVERDVPDPIQAPEVRVKVAVRDLPQRRAHEGGPDARHHLSPRSGTRDRRAPSIVSAPTRAGGKSGIAWDRVARRALRLVRVVPARRLPHVPRRAAGARDLVRRRLRGLRDRSGRRARPHSRPADSSSKRRPLMCAGITTFNRSATPGRALPTSWRSSASAGSAISASSCFADGIPDRGDRAREGGGGARAKARRSTNTSTASRRIPARSSPGWGAQVILATVTSVARP